MAEESVSGGFNGLLPAGKGEEMSLQEQILGNDDLSVRTRNLLLNAKIYTVADLINITQEQLINIDGLGKKVLNEIKEYLAEKGVTLAGESEKIKSEIINKLMICSAMNGYMVATGTDFSVLRNPKWVRVFETKESLLAWIGENLTFLDKEGAELP